MTKQAKYILIGAAALTAMGAALLILSIAAVIGIGIISAESSEIKPAGNATQEKKNEKSVTNEKSVNNEKSARIKKPVGVFGEDESDATEDSSKSSANLRGTLAPELVGTWQRSEGSGHIDYTGKTQYKSGVYFTYELAANGAVKYSMEADTLSILQCKIAETKTAFGTASSDAVTLTINLNKTAHTKSNSCEAAEDIDEMLPAETVELKYELKTEYGETRLCLTGENGEACYQKSGD